MQFPKMALVEQQFDPQRIEDVPKAVRQEMASLPLAEKVKPGQSVAVTAGSRGIANIDAITKTIVDEFKKLGAQPFIFPAMGSHGGATAEGQIKVLANLRITESSMGCPIKSNMEPVYLGDAALGYPINVDKNAMAADHIVAVNRVKPHTKFEGPIESGLMKMMAIGMGKQKGAEYYHKAAVQLTFQKGNRRPRGDEAVSDSVWTGSGRKCLPSNLSCKGAVTGGYFGRRKKTSCYFKRAHGKAAV
jgi:nickel-dependent lactate racemase